MTSVLRIAHLRIAHQGAILRWAILRVIKKITLKIAFIDLKFTFRSPKSHKNPGMGGWGNRFGKDFPKNVF